MIKTKRNRKWKIPHTVLDRRTLCFSSSKNRKLKIKLWWVEAHNRKKKAFFVPFILTEWKFFNICVLYQCIVYSIHFQNIHIFTYQKALLHTLFCLFLKSSKAFSVSLNTETNTNISEFFDNMSSHSLLLTYFNQQDWQKTQKHLPIVFS